jgi:hypothetical protein
MRHLLLSLTALSLFIFLTGCRMVNGVCDCHDPGAACLCGACGYQDVLKGPAHPVGAPIEHNHAPIYNNTPIEQAPIQQLPRGNAEPPVTPKTGTTLPNF